MTDTRNADLTYAAGDVIGYCAQLGTPAPAGPASVVTLAAPWICLGWIETSGAIYKYAKAVKDITAAGTLDPIRTLITGAPKTIEATFQEGFNPMVRALYDDVDVSSLQPSTGTIATYNLPEIPSDRRYCFVFDTLDGDKESPAVRAERQGHRAGRRPDAAGRHRDARDDPLAVPGAGRLGPDRSPADRQLRRR